jgi:hypothetical protein
MTAGGLPKNPKKRIFCGRLSCFMQNRFMRFWGMLFMSTGSVAEQLLFGGGSAVID